MLSPKQKIKNAGIILAKPADFPAIEPLIKALKAKKSKFTGDNLPEILEGIALETPVEVAKGRTVKWHEAVQRVGTDVETLALAIFGSGEIKDGA